jgi:hypothetical protein
VTSLSDDQRARAVTAAPFALAGAVCVVTGGLAAAVTGPTGWDDGSWVAAYLVLVAGVAQIGLGAGRAALAPRVPSTRRVTAEWIAWNAGNAGVVGGTLVDVPTVVSSGGALLVAALVLFTIATWGRSAPVAGPSRWPRRAFLALEVVLLVSIPIGLTLSWWRT